MRSRVRARSGWRRMSPGWVGVAVALEDPPGFQEMTEFGITEILGVFVSQDESFRGPSLIAGAITCTERQLAIRLPGEGEASNRAWNRDGFVSEKTSVLDDAALLAEVHVGGRGGGSFFAVVEEVHVAVGHAG